MLTQNDIKASHATGFGGSDAALVMRAATNTTLSASDIRRIRQAFGLEPLSDDEVYTPAMAKGHDFERWYGEHLAKVEAEFGTDFEAEHLLEDDFGTPFRTFAHADFFEPNGLGGHVTECKCTQDDDLDDVRQRYYAQMQWYYLLGADAVWLAWHPSTTFDFSEHHLVEVSIPRDEYVIGQLRQGIANIAAMAESLAASNGVAKAEDFEDATPAIIAELTAAVAEMKAVEAKIADFKDRLKAAMEKAGVVKIEGDALTITYVGETTARTFDKKALAKAHPELDLTQFEKESKRGAYIKITEK